MAPDISRIGVSTLAYLSQGILAAVLVHPDILKKLDRVVEIPVYGLPYAHNAATAAAIAMYEYCRQYPLG